jgi:hypothetical protein
MFNAVIVQEVFGVVIVRSAVVSPMTAVSPVVGGGASQLAGVLQDSSPEVGPIQLVTALLFSASSITPSKGRTRLKQVLK